MARKESSAGSGQRIGGQKKEQSRITKQDWVPDTISPSSGNFNGQKIRQTSKKNFGYQLTTQISKMKFNSYFTWIWKQI